MSHTCIDLYNGEYDGSFAHTYNKLKTAIASEDDNDKYAQLYFAVFDHVIAGHKYLGDNPSFAEIIYIQIQHLLDMRFIISPDSKHKLNAYVILLSPYISKFQDERKCNICFENLNHFEDERKHMWMSHNMIQNAYTNSAKNKQKWLRRSPRVPKVIYKNTK